MALFAASGWDPSALAKVFERGVAMPASIFALNIQGTTVEETGLGLDIGEADRVCLPIENTLTMEPWQKRPTAQLLLTMYELDRETPFLPTLGWYCRTLLSGLRNWR